jgi:hypothetical protein
VFKNIAVIISVLVLLILASCNKITRYNPFSGRNRASGHTSYVYSPGLFASPVLIGRYCPCYKADTGEVICGLRGGDIFGDGIRVTAVTFSDINTDGNRGWFRRTVGEWLTKKIFKSRFGIVVREVPGAPESIFYYLPSPSQATIAQEDDIRCLRLAFEAHQERFPDNPVIMFGDSRGAATTFNFIACHKPPIAGAILEGIFDEVPHAIKHCLRWSKKSATTQKCFNWLLKKCVWQYNPDGPSPLSYVDQIPLDVPLLLVTSLIDEIVPHQCTMRLYCRLKARGHQKVRLLVLEKSSYECYMVGAERDRYEAVVHAFYRSCDVDYDVARADKGQADFEQTAPTVKEVYERYAVKKTCRCDAELVALLDRG